MKDMIDEAFQKKKNMLKEVKGLAQSARKLAKVCLISHQFLKCII